MPSTTAPRVVAVDGHGVVRVTLAEPADRLVIKLAERLT